MKYSPADSTRRLHVPRRGSFQQNRLVSSSVTIIRYADDAIFLFKKIDIEDLSEDDIAPDICQKAVDIKMGLDIALIAIKKLADVLVIISGDSDLVPVLKFARREGMIVKLDPLWSPVRPELLEHIDYLKHT